MLGVADHDWPLSLHLEQGECVRPPAGEVAQPVTASQSLVGLVSVVTPPTHPAVLTPHSHRPVPAEAEEEVVAA